VPDREVAARLASLRRESVDLERRLRASDTSAPDAEAYWRSQIDAWRGLLERALTRYPIQARAMQQALQPAAADQGTGWADAALRELAEIRSRLDSTIERIG